MVDFLTIYHIYILKLYSMLLHVYKIEPKDQNVFAALPFVYLFI